MEAYETTTGQFLVVRFTKPLTPNAKHRKPRSVHIILNDEPARSFGELFHSATLCGLLCSDDAPDGQSCKTDDWVLDPEAVLDCRTCVGKMHSDQWWRQAMHEHHEGRRWDREEKSA